MVSRLEALADAVVKYSGYLDPESAAYQNRNPGNLPAFSPKHPRDEVGKRQFRSHLDGYQALLFDLAVKCAGRSHSGLKPDSTLRDLAAVYGQPETAAGYYAKFLRRALGDPSISDKTALSYFVEAPE
jgi:hypothetical protein